MSDRPLTRRQWIGQVSAGAAGMFATSLAVAAADEKPNLSFAVVTDTHLGHKNSETAKKRWTATAGELAKADVQFIVHLGDVVDGGREAQYTIYKEIRDSIGKPVYEIPGNHDPAEAFARELRKEIDTTIDQGWLRLVLMNNARRTSHDGFFEEKQLDWLAKVADQAAKDNKAMLVCCHVPVHFNRPPDRAWYVKPDNGQTRFYEILEQYKGRVVGVFHGHFHNGLRGWNDRAPLHEICFPSVLYNQNRALEEKNAPGYNPVEFRPGYCLATLGDGKLTLKYKPTGEDAAMSKTLGSI